MPPKKSSTKRPKPKTKKSKPKKRAPTKRKISTQKRTKRKIAPKKRPTPKRKSRKPTPPIVEEKIVAPVPVDEDEENVEIDKRWYTATKYKDLISLNKEFIKGKLRATPYHFGALEIHDKKLMDRLLKLHHYGLLTHNGQESNCEYGTYLPKGPYFYDEEQRGFVDFYVDLLENEFLAAFLAREIKASGLIFNIYNIRTDTQETNIPTGTKFNLTRGRTSSTRETLAEKKWDNTTNMPSNLKRQHVLWDLANADRILSHAMHFSVILPDYCKGDIESMVLEMCEMANKNGKVQKY